MEKNTIKKRYTFKLTNSHSGTIFYVYIKGINMMNAYENCLKKFKTPLYKDHAIIR